MSKFSIQCELAEPGRLKVTLEGQLDEEARFDDAKINGEENVSIDLEKVKSINSCGIREWIKWIRTFSSSSNIELHNCPKVVVDQINMVAGFLPENAEVKSFYVPFFSEESGDEKMILFEQGKQFDANGLKEIEEVKDDSGNEMEMDVIEAKYFKFLKR